MKMTRTKLRKFIAEHMTKPSAPSMINSDRALGNLDDMVRDPKYRDEYDEVAKTLGYPEDRSYADDLKSYDDSGRLGPAISQMRTLGEKYAEGDHHKESEGYYFNKRSALKKAAAICDSFDMSIVKVLIDAFTEGANDYERKVAKHMGLSSPFGVGRPNRYQHEAYDLAGRIALSSHKLDLSKENYSDLY